MDPLSLLEDRLVAWARERDDVVGVVVVGSRARGEQPADEWSDLDVGLITTRPRRYRRDGAWIAELGEPRLVVRDPEGITWHVLLADGAEAGIAPIGTRAVTLLRVLLLVPARIGWAARVRREVAEYTGRGVRILVDKRGDLTRLHTRLPSGSPTTALPDAEAFEAAVVELWFKAVWMAKHLRRGELWYARATALDGRMRALVLTMLTWHTRASRPDVDTWRDGRHLERWADPAWLDALAPTFAGPEVDDLWSALDATMDVFRDLATRTAALLGHPYPADADVFATATVAALDPRPPHPDRGT